ncbi:hypothetical protein TCON_1475 [Astathelohania contejeani]|uniref:Uncharacterized protein n=1 Tax=Astathelohania contejeani TaxID=164912 RepID=A0ABQ7HYX3_9MICR|nr:hypothetical protein TCON_1475 [Thelohania contejeani]
MLISNWKHSIEIKISALNNSIELLKKIKDKSELSGIEIKAAKQIINKLNHTLEKLHDVMETMILLKEFACIHEKSLKYKFNAKSVHRKYCFESYMSKFYRKFSGVVEPENGWISVR